MIKMLEDLELIDKKSRKLLDMYGGLHPRSNVERLHMLRVLGGRHNICLDLNEKEKLCVGKYITSPKNVYNQLSILA